MKKLLFLFAAALLTLSCTKSDDKGDEVPDTLTGTSWTHSDSTVFQGVETSTTMTLNFTTESDVTMTSTSGSPGTPSAKSSGTYAYDPPTVIVTIAESQAGTVSGRRMIFPDDEGGTIFIKQ